MTSTIDISILRNRLHYNPESGDLIWRASGVLATRQNPKNSRLEVRIKQIIFQAHRICWVLHYGEWPPHHIDHINRDIGDRLNWVADLTLTHQPSYMRHEVSPGNA